MLAGILTVEVMASEKSVHSNRLAREKSPYLLQHKDNPVDWYPWGDEAFQKAKAEDKPVFLSIGYSTCHWCHVMEEESFENAETAKVLNDHFVSIKVDREERPDLDSVYMSYVQAVTGTGGWPMSVFLTPDKKPFYGGTYFPPQDRWGMPGFPALLRSIAESWKTRRQEILDSADSAVSFLSKQPSKGPSSPAISAETLELAFRRFSEGFDETYGGFGRAPKFPRSHALSLLLRYWLRTKEARALEIVERTLEAMAAGGLYDQLGGGFHRYSTDAAWRIPHFEKMLYDQALLAQIYTEAFQATGKPLYARIARGTLDYVLTRLASPEGAFYSAEDADSPDPAEPSRKREGAYYVWEKAEIEKTLGADAKLFNDHYGIEENGNAVADPHNEFTGRNVLYVAHPASEEAERALARGRAALLRVREKRPRPHLDDKVLTDWNAMMIAALAKASIVFAEPRYREAAEKAARFLERTMKDGSGGLLHRYRDGDAAIQANLNDYAFLLDATLHLYEATFDAAWLSRAKDLADAMIARFWDADGGGFYLTAADAEVLISRPKEIYDGAIPSGNSAAALALIRLARFTGEQRYQRHAEHTIGCFSETIAFDPSNYPMMLQALDFTLGPSREIVVASERRDAASGALLDEVRKRFYPNQVVLLAVPGAAAQALAKIAPFVADKKPVSGKAAAYVCRNHACQLPVTEPEALRRILQ